MPLHLLRLRAPALVGLAAMLLAAPAAGAGPSRVLLGTAGGYAVLAGSGMTNTGVSTISGDIGSSPTHSQAGFAACPAADCVNLTGINHDDADPNDATTQQAKADLVTAYDDAFARSADATVSAPLGGGQTLVSGVYTSATDLFVGGDLTLDAAGDPDAVFIFQAKTGTLTTAAGITAGVPNTRVLLANGAQACNVFWQVGSSATISTFTQFTGAILANQSITVNTGATIDSGHALARNGAVTLDANTITRAVCATPPPAVVPAPAPAAASPAPPPPVAPSPETAPLSLAPPLLVAVPAGSARISGPSRPVGGPFNVTVTGTAIGSVTFYLDGRRIRTIRARPGQTRFVVRIDPRRQSTRVHRITARVRFRRPQGGSTTRRYTYRPVAPAPVPPRFTG